MILVVALIIFGPRKLPELGKSLGHGLAQFRRASDDFKRQWEEEVETEKRRLDAPPAAEAARPSEAAGQEYNTAPIGEPAHAGAAGDVHATGEEKIYAPAPMVEPASVPRSDAAAKETKRDWM